MYYTYAYLREDKTPYYIGKGTGKRIYSTNRKGLKPPKDKSRIIYLKQNLTEEEAFKHEIYMIDVFGRIDLGTGILHNRTDGGEGSSGCVPSEETKIKKSEAMKGKTHSEETKRKMSEVHKDKTFSEETRRKLSEAHKGKILSEEHRRKLSEAHKGHNVSEETRKKLSDIRKGKKWWNDGCRNCKRMIECPGDGWKPGRK
jgi:NUMOD3 motif